MEEKIKRIYTSLIKEHFKGLFWHIQRKDKNSGFSRNLRKEYTKSPRYYFWDNGIRNSLISNYNGLNLNPFLNHSPFLFR